MIELLIQSYLSLLLIIGGSALFIFIVGAYWIVKPKKIAHQKASQPMVKSAELHQALQQTHEAAKEVSAKSADFHHDHIAAIAGEDVIATQLDLARAYIETGKKQSAKNMLDHVIAAGNMAQQNEAQLLKQLL